MSQVFSGTSSFIGENAPTKSIWTVPVTVATITMLVSGSMNTVSFKLENEQGFKHGMVQTALMFFGEYLNILIFGGIMMIGSQREKNFIEMKENAEKEDPAKNPNPSKLLIAIPAFMDSCGSSLQVVPLLLIPASVNQMLRGGVIIFTCIFSKIFLKREIYRHHYLGVSLLVFGFILVGIASVVTSGSGSGSVGVGGTVLGIVMVLISLVIQAGQFVVEETILKHNQISAQRMVGLEGIFGMIFIFMWIMIFTFIPCPSSDLCDPYSGLEDPIAGVIQLFYNKMLLFWCGVTILSIMLFNVNGLILTQRVSAVFRAFWDATRTVLVWVICLAFGIDAFDWVGFWLQLGGFVLLLGGNFVYNEMVEIKCFKMNKYLRKYANKTPTKNAEKGKMISDGNDDED